ncbi:MAG: TetR/AcrR family transcriptional regulator [Anaerolineae bacterium]
MYRAHLGEVYWSTSMARQREFVESDVIERAMWLFAAQGYEATSIRDLKQAMAISSSSMYETFGDKRGIFLAALARFCELERAQIAQMAADSAGPRDFIERLFRSIDTMVAQTAPPIHGSLAFNAMVEFGTRDSEVTNLLLTHYFGIAEIIANVLAQAQVKSASDNATLSIAYTLLSTLHGVATLKSVKPDFQHISNITQVILKLLED